MVQGHLEPQTWGVSFCVTLLRHLKALSLYQCTELLFLAFNNI